MSDQTSTSAQALAPSELTGWRFDFVAADVAADELLLTAQSLLEVVALLELDLPVVTEDWTGRFREVFDVEMLGQDVSLRVLADALFALATLVRANAVEAAASWTP